MRILTYTSLYPNSVQTRHGIFIENRLRHLIAKKKVKLTVIAPVPWFPFKNRKFGSYSEFASISSYEKRYGIDIYHPRYPVIPKVGMNFSPLLMYYFTRNFVKKIIDKLGGVDLIDAHYFFPDGVAAARIAKLLCIPLVISARGTDINVIPNYRRPLKQIIQAADQANGLITVSEALKERLISLGVTAEKISTIRNGVDLNLFHQNKREETRKQYGMDNITLLSVGNLVELKGHHIVIEAMKYFPDMKLVIVGKGVKKNTLVNLAQSLNVMNQILFIENVSQEYLSQLYSAADITVLASSREGMPNVILESIACGTPVVATDVGGIPEILKSIKSGVLMRTRNVDELVLALKTLIDNYPRRADIRADLCDFSWDEVIEKQFCFFQSVVNNA